MSLSNSAKMLRAYIAATGITDSRELSAKLDVTLRTVYRLKLDLAAELAESATDGTATSATTAITATSATDGTDQNADCATDGTPTCNQQKEIPPTPPKEKLHYLETTLTQNTTVPARERAPTTGRQFWADAFADPATEYGVELVEGQIVLVNGTRQRWEAELGAKQLDLALIELAANLQTNSGKSIKLQVERGLARLAREKHDRDSRYKSAVAAKAQATKPAVSAVRTRF